MAWTLVDQSKIEKDTLRKSVLDTLIMELVVGDLIPWETIGQLNTTIVRIQDLPSVGFRKLNAGFSEGTGHLEQEVESISLMGGYFDTDKVLTRTKNTIADARAISQMMHLKAMSYKFNDKFINGNPESDPEEFKGLKERIEYIRSTAGGSYTGQYINNGGTTGKGILLNSTERQHFLDSMHKLQYSIQGHKPDCYLLNSDLLLAAGSVLRREGLFRSDKDQFERPFDIFNGVPMKDIGVKADQSTEIITSTEALEADGGSESTSIYAMKFGIGESFWGIQTYPLEVDDKGLLDTLPLYRTEMDWPLGLALANPYAIARLYAIIPNAST